MSTQETLERVTGLTKELLNLVIQENNLLVMHGLDELNDEVENVHERYREIIGEGS